jgi:hypothetical protein
MINWRRLYNKLFDLINKPAPLYFSGPMFINTIREVDQYCLSYAQLMEELREKGESTSRQDYFYYLLQKYDEPTRISIINAILEKTKAFDPELTNSIRNELVDISGVPKPVLNAEIWNNEKLLFLINEIDNSITRGDYSRAVTLEYTCLEGFYKAYIRKNIPTETSENEIIKLSKLIKDDLKQRLIEYPEESISMIGHIAHTIDKARNKFSESHFSGDASRWLSIFLKDLMNSTVRLLLNFM